ncbi:hypothetical protein RSAG8_07388, partial [Rhizoctonia solani AG-8 WAC10335]
MLWVHIQPNDPGIRTRAIWVVGISPLLASRYATMSYRGLQRTVSVRELRPTYLDPFGSVKPVSSGFEDGLGYSKQPAPDLE